MSRIESDEFVIVLNVNEAGNDADTIINQLLDVIRQLYTIQERKVIIIASAGIDSKKKIKFPVTPHLLRGLGFKHF